MDLTLVFMPDLVWLEILRYGAKTPQALIDVHDHVPLWAKASKLAMKKLFCRALDSQRTLINIFGCKQCRALPCRGTIHCYNVRRSRKGYDTVEKEYYITCVPETYCLQRTDIEGNLLPGGGCRYTNTYKASDLLKLSIMLHGGADKFARMVQTK